MPTLSRLIKEGAVTWSATAVKPALRLPTMASLITGMPVEKHGITWNTFEFSRGYHAPRVCSTTLISAGGVTARFSSWTNRSISWRDLNPIRTIRCAGL